MPYGKSMPLLNYRTKIPLARTLAEFAKAVPVPVSLTTAELWRWRSDMPAS